MIHRNTIRVRRFARKALSKSGTPEQAARGLAAGFFAAAFPLPGLQIPIALLVAWAVRGNKFIAVMPQFLSNAGTMLPLAYFQFWIGSKLWPGVAGDVRMALRGVEDAFERWSWSSFWSSLGDILAQLAGLGSDVIGPMCLGILITGVGMALIAYPLGLIAVTQYQHYRLRRRRERGLGMRPARPVLLPPPPATEMTEEEAVHRYTIHHVTVVRAQGVKLLLDGREAFPEMLACIAAAKKSIELETYILCADYTGKRFGTALISAARRGVAVRLMYDGVGGMGLPDSYVNTLTLNGVRVGVFRPLAKFWKNGFSIMNRRDHRKILVIDGTVGFTGGLNISDDYAAAEEFGGGWRDTHLRLDGDVPVGQLQNLFETSWSIADEFEPPDSDEEAEQFPALPPDAEQERAAECKTGYTSADVAVQILSNREFLQRVRMRRAYLQAIRHARQYILIENAYFIPDRGIRRALYQAVTRGVTVIVVIARTSDVRIAKLASKALYNELLAGGVRIFEYPLSMLHSKIAVIDDVWSMVGSYNLDHRSLLHNLEAGVLLIDKPFAEAIRGQILKDIANSEEVTKETHAERSWNEALFESLAYQARYWL